MFKIPYEYEAKLIKTAQVEYSKYINYMDNHTIENYGELDSVCDKLKSKIDDAGNAGIEHLIERQSGQAWSQVGELISNAIDASIEGFEIGRFGIGFKQVLQELKHQNATVIVITKSLLQPVHGRLLEFELKKDKEKGKVYLRDIKIPTNKIETGTKIIINRQLSEGEQKDIETYIIKKYQRCFYTTIKVNGKSINGCIDIFEISGSPAAIHSKEKEINIKISKEGYEISDDGKGMVDEIIYKHFLLSGQSTKSIVAGGEGFFYYKSLAKEKQNKNISTIKLIVSGVTIEELKATAEDLPQEVIIYLPYATQLSSARCDLIIDEKFLKGLENLVEKILAAKNQKIFRIDMINCIVTVLNILNSRTHVGPQEREWIESLKNRIRKGLIDILDPTQSYLPRIEGCQYFDMNTDKVIYLDPAIYPEQIIEKVEGIKRISTFESTSYKAYMIPFKKSESHLPVYISFGNILVFDKAMYDFYKDVPDPLNLMLNYWIGYGNKPKLKGEFRKEENKDKLMKIIPIVGLNNTDIIEDKDYYKDDPLPEEPEIKENEIGTSEKNTPNTDYKTVDEHAEKIAKKILKNYELIEEEIFKDISSSSYFFDNNSSSNIAVAKIFKQDKKIEQLVKKHIKKDLENKKDQKKIKAEVIEFLDRYVMLEMNNIGINNCIDIFAINDIINEGHHYYDNELIKLCKLGNKLKVIKNILDIAVSETNIFFLLGRNNTCRVYQDGKKIEGNFDDFIEFKVLNEDVFWIGGGGNSINMRYIKMD